MEWKDKIEEAVDTLKGSVNLNDAVRVMNHRWGTSFSKGALRKALKRYDYDTPSAYINDEHEIPEADEEIVEEDDPKPEYDEVQNAWKDTDYESEQYVFRWRFDDYTISFDEMSNILVKYSNVGPGKGMTRNEIARYYQGYDKRWAIPEFLKWMFQTIGFTKKKFPCPPHKLHEDQKSIISSAYERKDAMVRGEKNEEILKEQRKLIEDLYEEINDITRVVSLDDEILEEAEVKELDLSDEEFRKGHRTKVISINDLHNGKEVEDLPHTKEQNVFNKEIFQNRLNRVCNLIAGTSDEADYDLVYVAGLGDYFEALLMNMREYQWTGSYNHGQEQYRAVKEAWIKIISTVVESYDCEIKTIIQGGNHDRLTENRGAGSEEILAFQLCENVRDYFRDTQRVDISFGAGVVSTMLPSGVNLIHFHGHKKKLKKNRDFDQFIRLHGYSEAERYVVMQGHWHCFKVLTGHEFRALWMPAFCGNDRFNREQITKGALPEFAMLDICGRHDRIVGPFNLEYDR